MQQDTLNNIQIVLVGTLQSGNIGSVARAMKNMGLKNLLLVDPQCEIDKQASMMATHAGDLLDTTTIENTLREAVQGSAYIFGTTARDRKWRDVISPKDLAARALPRAHQNKVSIVFGPEDKGLSNEELELCNEVVTIPTREDAASLNISHAVLIVCYELFCGMNNFNYTENALADIKLADSAKVEEMFDHMRQVLLDVGFLNPQNPDHVLGYFKRFFSRAGICNKDVRTIRGVFRQLQWYIDQTKGYFKEKKP